MNSTNCIRFEPNYHPINPAPAKRPIRPVQGCIDANVAEIGIWLAMVIVSSMVIIGLFLMFRGTR